MFPIGRLTIGQLFYPIGARTLDEITSSASTYVQYLVGSDSSICVSRKRMSSYWLVQLADSCAYNMPRSNLRSRDARFG